jgi:hypothetical protein
MWSPTEFVAVIERASATRADRQLEMDCCAVYWTNGNRIADSEQWDSFWS